ncbi:SNF related kinase b [Carcharodon carcharias]|uniref:SNF related kinase b n=1 Tax=Carcharodon carcharias TaxID=13397 RepID=UPI001B7EB42B|nr:SNF related kinase b [Carcharodon carcharias]
MAGLRHCYDGKIAGLYDLDKTLGKGHYAVVKLARHVFTGEKVAVKVIDKTKLDKSATGHLLQEVRCMKLVQHPNVVRLYEVIDTQSKLYLILELGDGGDMFDYIMNHEKGLSEDQAKIYFAQIVHAISYCHKLHVVHRDLKPENVVFFKEQGVVKLTDFGFSNRFQPGKMLTTSCGSLAYSAPEILLGDEYDAPAVDIWSLGVILYMLVCGYPPFHEVNDSETLTMIMDCRYTVPQHISADCRNLISRMLQRDPKKRASLEEIEGHPWLQGIDPSPAKKLSLPLTSYKSLSEEEHEIIIQAMECGNIAQRELIQEALEADKYNHITASYFLLAERILREKQEKQTQSRNLNLEYNWTTHVQCRPSLSAPENSFVDATDNSPLPEVHNGFSIKHSTNTKGPTKQPEAMQKDIEKTETSNIKDIVKIVNNAQDSPASPSPMRILLRSSLETSVMPKNVPVLQQICEEDEEEEEEDIAEMEVKATPLPSVMPAPCSGANQQVNSVIPLSCPNKDSDKGDGNKLFREMWNCQRENGVMSSSVEVQGSVGPLCCSRWAEKSEQVSNYFGNRPINLMNESNNNSTSKSVLRAPVDISAISVEKPPPCLHAHQCLSSLDPKVTEPTMSTQISTDLAKEKLQMLKKCEGPSVESPKHLIDRMAENSGLANDSACFDSSADPVNKFDPTRSKNVNIRDRILQIPLCEKALSFKIKPNSKENLLSFGQFNCCHVI